MPLEVDVTVVPGGHEFARHKIRRIEIIQIAELDGDVDGWRIYEVIGVRRSTLRHKRSDGAAVLSAKALLVDAGHADILVGLG